MKKNLFLLLAFAGFVFTFLSCSSDIDAPTLDGTTWVCPKDADGVRILKFTKTNFKATLFGKDYSSTNTGKYTYEPPTVTLTYINQKTYEEITVKGLLNENKLTINNVVYTKQ